MASAARAMVRSVCTAASLLLFVGLFTSPARGYGPMGHRLVGAIADQLLEDDPAVAKQVSSLLKGLSLEKAALLPDDIKKWDDADADDPDAFHLKSINAEQKILERQLKAFWKANPPTETDANKPNHHWFHYTDVSVHHAGILYKNGLVGTSEFDIVHMVPYCMDVLSGKQSSTNARRITKRVALILLAHYIGDLHQPLHVGAEYFITGAIVDPDHPPANTTVFPDRGGGAVALRLKHSIDDHGHPVWEVGLHGYWDGEAVDRARGLLFREMKDDPEYGPSAGSDDLPQWLAEHGPTGWKNGMGTDSSKWAENWANEVLPISFQAHERLRFFDIDPQSGKYMFVKAEEKKPQPGNVSYPNWAGKVVRDEIHKAGWRLAEVVRRCLKGSD